MADQQKPAGNRMPAPQGAAPAPSLTPPVHSDEIVNPVPQHTVSREGDSGTNIKVDAPQTGPIEVVALREGFIYNMRKVAGNVFKVADLEAVGEWMKCVDPEMEKRAREHHKAKLAKAIEEQRKARW